MNYGTDKSRIVYDSIYVKITHVGNGGRWKIRMEETLAEMTRFGLALETTQPPYVWIHYNLKHALHIHL